MGILLAIHVLVTIFLILIVLIQKNEGGSSLFANSATGGMFNARGTSNFLTKTTWILASIFLVNCVLMATLEASKVKGASTIIEDRGDDLETTSQESTAEEDEDSLSEVSESEGAEESDVSEDADGEAE